MLLKLAFTALAIVVVLLVVVALRPAAFRVARSRIVTAPADVVFAQIANLHAWERWMPFDAMDPTVVKTFSGPATGVGSSYHYRGQKIGEGRMTIIALVPGHRVDVRAEFVTPMRATNRVELALRRVASGVEVTWAMNGTHSFVGKAFSFVLDIDAMVGKDFERGLENLGRVAEAEARRPALAPTTKVASHG